jgi:hypothetical protein
VRDIFDGIGPGDFKVAQWTQNAQSMFPNRIKVGASGDKGHIVPGGGQSGTEIPADSAGSENHDLQRHVKFLSTRQNNVSGPLMVSPIVR